MCFAQYKSNQYFGEYSKKTTSNQYFYLSVNLLVDRFGLPTQQFIT